MTITLTREEAQQVLDSLIEARSSMQYGGIYDKAAETLRTRLAQPNPINKEPTKLLLIPDLMEQAGWVRKKEWVWLTSEEAKSVWKQLNYDFNHGKFASDDAERHVIVELCRAIEAKLKEKNT